jgi:hypothetical protein
MKSNRDNSKIAKTAGLLAGNKPFNIVKANLWFQAGQAEWAGLDYEEGYTS